MGIINPLFRKRNNFGFYSKKINVSLPSDKPPRGIHPKLLAQLENHNPNDVIFNLPKWTKKKAVKLRQKIKNSRPLSELVVKEKLQEMGIRFEQLKLLNFKLSFRVVDFYLPDHRLIVEVDGSIHEKSAERDAAKDAEALKYNLKTLRIPNKHCLNFRAIFNQYLSNFGERGSQPYPNLVDPRVSKVESSSVENAALENKHSSNNQTNTKQTETNEEALTQSMDITVASV